jgi:hypothetical protein
MIHINSGLKIGNKMIYFDYMTKPTTVRFNTYNTRRNLPPDSGRKRGEANFLGAFERHLLSNVFTAGFGGKHFSLSNYGVADFVWLLPPPKKQKNGVFKLYAFETKIKNWRRAFQQAYRYSYYSDVSYVVLPPDSGEVASRYLDLFQLHNIGLWTFDPSIGSICQIANPQNPMARNPIAKNKAVNVISSRIQLSKRPESLNAFANCL